MWTLECGHPWVESRLRLGLPGLPAFFRCSSRGYGWTCILFPGCLSAGELIRSRAVGKATRPDGVCNHGQPALSAPELKPKRLCTHVPCQVFKSDIGPDGNARDELDVACAVDHPNLTKSLGVVRASNAKSSGGRSGSTATDGAPEAAGSGGSGGGSSGVEHLRWLVMERVVGQPLAEKPDFSSVLRCRWGSGRRFEPVLVLAVLLQVRLCAAWLGVGSYEVLAQTLGAGANHHVCMHTTTAKQTKHVNFWVHAHLSVHAYGT